MKTAIVIPAYNPDERLLALCGELLKTNGFEIIVVDDGSRPDRDFLFRELGSTCIVVRHPVNLGKGEALKTGIRTAMRRCPGIAGIVTADADGQHLPADIAGISEALIGYPDAIVLGTRDFSLPGVPFKSRWGNRITSLVFRLGTGVYCPDTQTGLRAIPSRLFDFCLSVPGSRFEYEMNVLTEAAMAKIPLRAVPIETVYLDKNSSSHFRAFRDSVRIYGCILRFGLSSLAGAAADLAVFSALTYGIFGAGPSGILASTVIARCLSGALNFTLNKKWSFAVRGGGFAQALEYLVLFCAQMAASWALVTLLSGLPVNLTLIKLAVDSALFLLSYNIQRRYIFRKTSVGSGTAG